MKSYSKETPETIQQLFNSIAREYDRGNALLSFSLHNRWNRSLVQHSIEGKPPRVVLDLCSGTGEIAKHFLSMVHTPLEIFLLDFSKEMLEQAKAKLTPTSQQKLHFLQADAHHIPLPNHTIDIATIAYGIRNVQNPKQCIEEIKRVLKPKGTLAILELTQPTHPIARLGHTLYLKTIPTMGKWVTSNKPAYNYLCSSIQSFISPPKLCEILRQTGFEKTQMIPIYGGIATILLAKSPK